VPFAGERREDPYLNTRIFRLIWIKCLWPAKPAMSPHVLPSNVALAVVLLVLTAILYLFPGIVAVQRDHRHAVAILVFDLFLGWTFLGWVIALIWALTEVDYREWLQSVLTSISAIRKR
jgi:Superinfection immunity protein